MFAILKMFVALKMFVIPSAAVFQAERGTSRYETATLRGLCSRTSSFKSCGFCA